MYKRAGCAVSQIFKAINANERPIMKPTIQPLNSGVGKASISL